MPLLNSYETYNYQVPKPLFPVVINNKIMEKLLQLKPAIYLLIHFIIMIFSFFIFVVWTKLVPETSISLGFIIVAIGLVGGYLFWIYLILSGFNIIDLKNGLESNLNKAIIHLMIVFLGYLIIFVILVLYINKEIKIIPTLISILLASVLTYSLFEIVIILTRKFKYYDKKSKPNLLDYFVTLFSLSFYPFGIIMMHSHLRLIIREQGIIDIVSNKATNNTEQATHENNAQESI